MNTIMRDKILHVVFCLTLAFQAQAKIKLPALFTDNMMLQQEMETPIWGWANPNETVTVITSWNSTSYAVKANQKGQWKTLVRTPRATNIPYEIVLKTTEETTKIKNVLIGEVWLCSGQSNMEMPLKGFMGQPVIGGNDAIVRSTNNNIRLITVPRATVL